MVLALGGGCGSSHFGIHQLVLYPQMVIRYWDELFTLVEGITGISALILIGGVVYDWIKNRQRKRLRETPHG